LLIPPPSDFFIFLLLTPIALRPLLGRQVHTEQVSLTSSPKMLKQMAMEVRMDKSGQKPSVRAEDE
jgi:hypothetical protein